MAKLRSKKIKISFAGAAVLLVIGIILGSVFTFGMHYRNDEISKESCDTVQSELVSYKEIKRRGHIHEITVDCTNGERYFIDRVSVNTELSNSLSELSKGDSIHLLIHPNSNTIVEFSTDKGVILNFEETMEKLSKEKTGFLFLGIFMYFCAAVGLYYTVLHIYRKRK